MASDLHDEYRAALALRHTPGIGARTIKHLIDHYPSLSEAAACHGEWRELGLVRQASCQAFAAREWKEQAEAEYEAARAAGMRFLTVFDPRYPDLLRRIIDPPVCLYYEGRVSLLSNPSVAVVGSRDCSRYGLEVARMIGEELSTNGVTVVSGLALGIDRQAHLAGLAGIGKSAGVLGTGLDVVYPMANQDLREAMGREGCVVTEYPPGTKPDARFFPVRNRIISGLSLGVLVAEAAAKSGSLITATHALDQGRDVFALPGPLTQPTFTGCHTLIRQGAILVESAEDIIRELASSLARLIEYTGAGPGEEETAVQGSLELGTPASASRKPSRQPPRQPPPDLPEAEKSVHDALRGRDKAHVDEICRELELDSPTASSLLLSLEIKGLVRQWPGMYYSLK